MDRLIDKINDNQNLAATTQSQIRTRRRSVRRNLTPAIPKTGIFPQGNGDDHDGIDDAEPLFPIAALPAPIAPSPVSMAIPPHHAITLSPLDLPADQFRSGLDRRKQNRQLLMDWLRTALIEGTDFGRVHIASKDKCEHARVGRAKECTNQYHWSKPNLFKSGAEKITGMLGMTVHYPSLLGYENAFVSGHDVKQIMLRCELHDAHGRVVAEGVGARNITQDYGDINKALKMAEKSAHIDATLRLAGISEAYTQDLDTIPNQEDELPSQAASSERAPVARPRPPRSPRRPDGGLSSPPRSASQVPASSRPVYAHVPASTPVSAPAPGPRPAPGPTPVSPDIEIIGPDDVEVINERIAMTGISEKRVLAWLYKVTQGAVTRFEQLNVTQCSSLLKRLDAWAEEESARTRAA